MKEFQIFRYLKQWLPLILCFFVGMTIFAYRILAKKQYYIASAVIEYSNDQAKDGYAPDGSRIDVSEIVTSKNMTRVMENLGLPLESYSLDNLCASIKVEPVIEEQALNIQEAVNEEGEEYTIQPTAYVLSCKLNGAGTENLARDILNELLDTYFSDYSNKHINQEQVNNEVRDVMVTDYDYLEMVERVDQQLTSTIDTLHIRYLRGRYFRSSDTGYSFADLRDQFTLIRDVDIPRLYALILGNQITKDRALLLNKYENRIVNYGLTGQKAQEDIDDIMKIISAYVDKMRSSGNTDIDYNYILNDVYEREWGENGTMKSTDRTVQYDLLLHSWINASDRWDYAEIDAAYCAYILSVYRGEQGAGGTASEADVERELQAVIDKMNGLYEIVTRTNTEYNEYLGAQNIKTLSSVSVRPRFNMSLYLAIIAGFFLVVGCCGAILLGRVGDILEYVFLRDRATGCLNRVSCDKYIHDRESFILPLAACCVNIQILNQRELNDNFGRGVTDRVLMEFGRVLRDLFESRKGSFVGHNGGGQFWVFFETANQVTLLQEEERLTAMLADTLSDIPVSYQMGAANAGEQSVFQLRGLISSAAKLRKPYRTSGEGETQRTGSGTYRERKPCQVSENRGGTQETENGAHTERGPQRV